MRRTVVLIVLLLLMAGAVVALGIANNEKGWEISRLNSNQNELLAQQAVLSDNNSELMSQISELSKFPPSPKGQYHIGDSLPLGMVAGVADTGSMEPTLNGTSKIVLTKDPVGIGDIAVYETNDGGTAVHRIIGEQGSSWIFKGDKSGDVEIISKDKVLWRVKAVIY